MTELPNTSAPDILARRVLAVLECRASDVDVCTRAVTLLEEFGGFLTLVAITPRRFPWTNAGFHCSPVVSDDELRRAAEAAIALAVARVPSGITLSTVVVNGRRSNVIRRRVEIAAPDVVVLRGCRGRMAHLPVPVIAC